MMDGPAEADAGDAQGTRPPCPDDVRRDDAAELVDGRIDHVGAHFHTAGSELRPGLGDGIPQAAALDERLAAGQSGPQGFRPAGAVRSRARLETAGHGRDQLVADGGQQRAEAHPGKLLPKAPGHGLHFLVLEGELQGGSGHQ